MGIERGAARKMHAETDLVHVGPARGKRCKIASEWPTGVASPLQRARPTRLPALPRRGQALGMPDWRRQLRVQNRNPVLACTQARAAGVRCVALRKHAVCGRHSPEQGTRQCGRRTWSNRDLEASAARVATGSHSASPAVTPI